MKKKLNFTKFSIYFDPYLFIAITLLSIMGLVFLYSASQGDINTIAKQSVFVGFGLILMFMMSQPDPETSLGSHDSGASPIHFVEPARSLNLSRFTQFRRFTDSLC